MKILTVDIGTGTQDIFLYDSNLDIENGYKLVLPSPTMMVHRRLKQMLHARKPILLTGHQMGGGPSAWAIEETARAGIPVYMTPSAATTLNDELGKVEALGIQIVSEDEVKRLKSNVESLELKDFNFTLISKTFADYGVSLHDLEAIAVAVFDHGNAPEGTSDRQFRFDYLDERIKAKNSLSSFAYLSGDIPKIMTRLQSVADSAAGLPCPLVVMDTAPAAVLGANFDPKVAARKEKIICNVGNFHTLAFRLGGKGIEGVFEHHTGEIDLNKLESLLRRLADGSLKHEDVFDDMGHGALMYSQEPFEFGKDEFDVVVSGPRRNLFNRQSQIDDNVPFGDRKSLRPYFATPFGDMMIAGCFGLLAATAEILPRFGRTRSKVIKRRIWTWSRPMGSLINQERRMSNTVRWMIAIILILAGVITALFSLAFLGFFTWECYGPTNSIASTILYVAAVVSLIGGIVPAVMLIRKTAGKFVAIAIALSIVLTLAANGIFMFYTLNIC